MIPCKNCLVLAICRNKTQIKCTLLYDWWTNSDINVMWCAMSEYIPRISSVRAEDSKPGCLVIHNWDLIEWEVKKGAKFEAFHHYSDTSSDS